MTGAMKNEKWRMKNGQSGLPRGVAPPLQRCEAAFARRYNALLMLRTLSGKGRPGTLARLSSCQL